MRRMTICRRKKYERKERYVTIVTFFIAIPMITTLMGGTLAKKVIVPYITKSNITSNEIENVKNTTTQLDEINMYNIEVREFGSIQGAESFLKSLNEEGILGYVSKANKYKVFVNITFDKSKVEKQLLNIKSKHENAEIKYIEIGKKQLDISEGEEEAFKNILATVNLVNSAYSEELDMWSENVQSNDYEQLKKNMEKNTREIEESIKDHLEKIESDDLSTLSASLIININNRKRIEKELEPSNAESITKAYFEYMKTFFAYINYYKL